MLSACVIKLVITKTSSYNIQETEEGLSSLKDIILSPKHSGDDLKSKTH